MRKEYEVFFLDKTNKPYKFVTISETSKKRALSVGRNMASTMGGRLHGVNPLKT